MNFADWSFALCWEQRVRSICWQKNFMVRGGQSRRIDNMKRNWKITANTGAAFCALVAFLGSCPPSAAKKDDPQLILDRLPEGTIIERDIVYATNGDRKMLLDVYRPKSDQPLPLVIWFYGGAWDWGNKDRSQPLIPMLSRGYAIAGVTHTKSKEEIFPAVINDCRAAVSFLRLNAKRLTWTRNVSGRRVNRQGGT